MIVNKNFIPILLQLFDGEGGGTSEGTQAGASVADSKGTNAQQVADADAGVQQTDEDIEAEFEELIKGKYKNAYGKRFKEGINKRFKDNQATEQRMREADAVLARVAEMTGNTDTQDLAGLLSRLDDIDPHIQEEAIDRGIPVETLREMKRLERERNEAERAQQQMQADIQAQQQYQQWQQEASECKSLYGDSFNLEAELANEDFELLLKCGFPMRKAFEVCHIDEMVGGAMQYAARTTQTNIANDIRARGNRPTENGMRSNAPIKSSVDISSLSNDEMDIINKKIASGEIKTPADIPKYITR